MKAFVIMPYASEYDRTYRMIIKPAVESCGLECIRSDKTLEGGHIIGNVLRDLSESDIVVADLSDLNWNVAYELGIRHTMQKKGTIMICRNDVEFPFDISGYDIYIYDRDWIDKNLDEKITDEISSRIKKRMEASSQADNPVHNCFPALPESLSKMLSNTNDKEQRRIIELTTQIKELIGENESLKRRVEEAGLDTDDGKKLCENNIEKELMSAYENSKYISDTAVAKLNELLQEKKHEEFVHYLSQILINGYIDEDDCKKIFVMCRRLKNPNITRIFLEKAIELYPDSEDLQGYLADAYSNNYRTRDNALSMVNSMIGLTKHGGTFELSKKPRSERMLASFFNVYISTKKYVDIVAIGELLLKECPARSSIIKRNMCLAYRRLERYDEAKAIVDQLLNENPTDARNHYSAFWIFDDIGDNVRSYKEIEACIRCAPDDTDYYKLMAGNICDEKIARLSPNSEPQAIEPSQVESSAVPFILRAVEIDSDFAAEAIDFLRRNNFLSVMRHLYEFLCNRSDKSIEEEFSQYSFRMVDYCVAQ